MESISLENFSNRLENIASTYATDTIFIVGKGPSVDNIAKDVFKSSLVIAVNDAEKIAGADISVLHAPWVERSISDNNFQSSLYVSAYPFDAKGKPVAVFPHVRMTQESSDLLMQRLLADEIFIEDVLFLTALKLAKKVAAIRGRAQTVYMVGFDFNPSLGGSQSVGRNYSTDSEEASSIKISLQEYVFMNALYFLRGSDLDVKHVGDRSFSVLNADELNDLFSTHLSDKHKSPRSVEIVAELTTNHFGDRGRLERMIRLSKAAGADFIKLQKRDVEGFYTKEQLSSPYVSPFGATFGDYRHQLELSRDDFSFVNNLCSELGIRWFASVLDLNSFRFMQDVGLDVVKLPSTISEHTDYLSYVAENHSGAVVLSTGMTDQAYEDFVLNTFVHCNKLYLLQCNSAYPTPLRDCNIGVVRHYHDLSIRDSRIVPGYSSHDFGWKASALAVAAGAKMLEKHVKLGNTEWAHFDAVAVDLTTGDFKEYVDEIRESELIVGSNVKKVNDSEHHKYFVKKNEG